MQQKLQLLHSVSHAPNHEDIVLPRLLAEAEQQHAVLHGGDVVEVGDDGS